MECIEHLVRLALTPGIGPLSVKRLIGHFGNTDRIFGASEADLAAVEGIGPKQIAATRTAAHVDPRPELDRAAAAGVTLLAHSDPAYPELLRETYDPPFLLYVRGELKPRDALAVGVVGTRRASPYAREQAERFGGMLARSGLTVVSGLARGVDSCAHRGALDAAGRTLAIIGCGLNHMYPAENRDLAAEIACHGAVISEFPMDTEPARENFPRRNRIIAGLCLGVLVVEAPERSGALITARQAVEMNREVFAIPGRIDHENTAGCHALIREGATLVRDVDDVLAQIGPLPDRVGVQAALPLAEPSSGAGNAVDAQGVERRILDALEHDPVHIDALCAATGLPVEKISAALMILELKRVVRQHPGKFFSKSL